MRKLTGILLVVLSVLSTTGYAHTISTDPFITPDDVTIAHLENFRTNVLNGLNSFDGEHIQANSITDGALSVVIDSVTRWDEAFNDWVKSGLTIPTSANLTSTTATGIAYIDGKRINQAATEKTYTASKYTYVDLSSSGGYTYTETAIGAAEPAVTANSVRIARVSTDATQVLEVRDSRTLAISIDNNQADFWRTGLTVRITTPDEIVVYPGVTYIGNIRVQKTGNTSLDLGTAGDFVTGGGGRANSTMGFVVADAVGNVQLTTTAPTKHDVAGNSSGKLRYSVIGGSYYRVLAWFYMNATGAGNIDDYNWGNFVDGGSITSQVRITSDSEVNTTSDTYTDLDHTTLTYYSSGEPVQIRFNGTFTGSAATTVTKFLVDIDGTNYTFTENGVVSDNQAAAHYYSGSTEWDGVLSQGAHTIKVEWKRGVATNTHYSARRILSVRE